MLWIARGRFLLIADVYTDLSLSIEEVNIAASLSATSPALASSHLNSGLTLLAVILLPYVLMTAFMFPIHPFLNFDLAGGGELIAFESLEDYIPYETFWIFALPLRLLYAAVGGMLKFLLCDAILLLRFLFTDLEDNPQWGHYDRLRQIFESLFEAPLQIVLQLFLAMRSADTGSANLDQIYLSIGLSVISITTNVIRIRDGARKSEETILNYVVEILQVVSFERGEIKCKMNSKLTTLLVATRLATGRGTHPTHCGNSRRQAHRGRFFLGLRQAAHGRRWSRAQAHL